MKTLICINTCDRSLAIKAMIWDYILFVKNNKNYDLVVSLDGRDKKTINYCNKFNIPIVYSEEKEGVGLAKNRVISLLTKYSYYFFIEDDVELINQDIFDIMIDISKKANLHHLSLFPAYRIIDKVEITKVDKFNIIHSMYGSAQVNFFSKYGIEKVGGFHTEFAKYKRFGHTEHTYRFVNAKLAKYPFNIVKELIEGCFRWHEPISVTNIKVQTTKKRLFVEEEKLIQKKLDFFPVRTLSKVYKNFDNLELKVDQIDIDRFKINHKFNFYLQMSILNSIRRIKNNVKKIYK